MNLNYATAPDQQGNPEDLAMNIYYPKFIEDTMPKRPFIMLIHGGGYVSGDRSQLNSLCRVFAQRGFVTATITHRFGPGRTISTLYRAHQDAEAAMRYIAFYADSFRVDTAHMFMGGFSSGSNIAFDVIYTDEDEWLSIDPDFVNDFGGLYTTGNSLPNSFRVKGMFNNWGSAFLPAFDTTETVPMISFHGERDPIINIDVDSSIFRGGSRALHNFLTQSGQCSDLTVDPNGSHGVYNSQEGVVFRLNRTSCFFKSILCNSCSSSSSTEPIPPDCSGSTTTSIQDLSNFLTVYPNPFSDRIQVEGLMGDEKFTLLNSLG
ncbi:MAG: alpha/beta hydrolase, partial [Bacteroidota bacterium]